MTGNDGHFADDITSLQVGDFMELTAIVADHCTIASQNKIHLAAGVGVLDDNHIIGVVAANVLFRQQAAHPATG